MKKFIISIFVLSLFIISCNNNDSIDRDAESKAIETLVESYWDAITSYDMDTFRSFLTEDFLAFDMGNIFNTEEICTFILSFKDMGLEMSSELKIIRLEIAEEHALVCFKNTLNGNLGEQVMKMNYIESMNFKKIEGNWKISFIHNTEVPPQEN